MKRWQERCKRLKMNPNKEGLALKGEQVEVAESIEKKRGRDYIKNSLTNTRD